jgi:uncharacterized membrane protein
MHEALYALLQRIGLTVSKGYLKTKIETHPYYPSLLSIKDTLEELHAEVQVFKMLPEKFSTIGLPFLAHVKDKHEEKVIFIQKGADYLTYTKNTEFNFTGIVITAEAGAIPFENKENTQSLAKEKQANIFKTILTICALCLLLSPFCVAKVTFSEGIVFAANLIGLIFSYFIIEKEFGISNTVSDMICKLSAQKGCDGVLSSTGARITSWLTWGDIGLSYFAISLIYLTLSSVTQGLSQVPFYFTALAGILFPVYSLYYQLKIAKQFCMLCIGVLCALACNFFVALFVSPSLWHSTLTNILFSSVIFCIIGSAVLTLWLLFKAIFLKAHKSSIYHTLYRRTKRNPAVFMAVLNAKPTIAEGTVATEEPLAYGNINAPYQLLIACNPYCNPCAFAHTLVHEAFAKYPEHIRVGIRFVITQKNFSENSDKVQVVRHLLQYVKENPSETQNIIHAWYQLEDIEALMTQFPVTKSANVEHILIEYIAWDTKVSVRGTPTFWINGKELPSLYSWVDLFEHLPILIEDSIEKSGN